MSATAVTGGVLQSLTRFMLGAMRFTIVVESVIEMVQAIRKMLCLLDVSKTKQIKFSKDMGCGFRNPFLL